ncbi:uncharacterized protein LOC131650886 [Vicia villosa]|uniref:uncharacterized protein LOC131650886 n=1 Tax=Vicia villosa TaxID=3911 RepID=UPI00273BBD0F|nr:uncharacterized protein LOC131650886 [Vicia villosa]
MQKINLTKANKFCMVPSHTLFAGDIMIFCRGDVKSLKAISDLLKNYRNYSGQFYNYSKSLIYARGMTLAKHSSLANLIGFTMAIPPFIYFGVPFFLGKLKACYFLYIADKIRLKLAAWKAKTLPMAGRTQLVKSVILSMMVHCISIYNWPGGLEIIYLEAYNSATNIHLCWKFLNFNQSWSILFNDRVKTNGRLIKYAIKSSIWNGIKEAHGAVLDNCMWSIDNGRSVNFWLDNWTCETLANKYQIPEKFHYGLTSKLSDWWTNAWNINNNIQVALPNLLGTISRYSIPEVEVHDLFAWKNNINGILTIK